MSTPQPDSVARVRATFEAVADDYDQSGVPFFVPTAEGLVEALGPRPGAGARHRVRAWGRDLAAGPRGPGPMGAVDAIDLSPAMVDHTRALLAAQGYDVRAEVMDAGDPDLSPSTYDLIASSLVLFFLPDPAAALARWVSLLAPGGQIGLTTFGQEHAAWSAVNALFRPWLPPAMLDPKAAGSQSPFASDDGMEALLRAAGAGDVRTVTRRVDVPWGDVEGWKAFSMSTGQRAMWAMVPAEERDGLEARAAQILDEARDESGRIVIWQDMRYTLGRVSG